MFSIKKKLVSINLAHCKKQATLEKLASAIAVVQSSMITSLYKMVLLSNIDVAYAQYQGQEHSWSLKIFPK